MEVIVLLVVCHHLLIDGVSWRVLLADLQLVYRQLATNGRAEMLPPTSSVLSWLNALATRTQTETEEAFWRRMEDGSSQFRLPRDQPDGSNRMGDARSILIDFDSEETRRLIREVPKHYSIRVDELLIAALVRTVGDWTGHSSVAIQLESHGRDPTEGIDLSRTVGWLTALYPVLLPGPAEIGKLLKETKEVLRNIPGAGIGYSLHHGADENDEKAPLPDLRFNYLGQADPLFGHEDSLFGRASEPTGTARHADDPRDVVFELNALVSGGQLSIHWLYGSELHDEATVQSLASGFRQEVSNLMNHCLNPESGPGYVPSEFPQMDFEPDELDKILDDLESF
ncbi:MAG: condensation domain-containing protein [Verrucomicrobiota bacterium]